MKCQVDEMVSWWNRSWWNGKMMKWYVGET